MSNNPTPGGQSGDTQDSLQFDKAEFGQNPVLSCAFCKAPIHGDYFQVNGQSSCPACRSRVEEFVSGHGSTSAGAVRAMFAGIGAALAGFLVYWGIRAATGYEFALVAILVGWMVGKSVRWGAPRGGLFYQLLAIVLTYCSIASTYMPDIILGMRENRAEHREQVSADRSAEKRNDAAGEPEPSKNRSGEAAERPHVSLPIEVGFAFAIALAAPFLMGTSNILGWIIIAVGLLQAWRLTKRLPLQITGPFQLGGTLPPA